MSSSHLPFLSKIFPCIADGGEPLSPDDERSPGSQQRTFHQPSSAPDKKHETSKLMAEAYVPTWQRASSDSGTRPVTGRRKAASTSAGSAPAPPASRARSESEAGNMLYFGDGSSPQHNTYTPRARARATSTGNAGTTGATPGLGFASGRDASGHLRTGISDSNPMNGTYATLTYGGSLGYNFAGTQNPGAGM